MTGSEIRRARLALGVTLREAARRAKISAAFLSDVELGHRRPSVEVERRLTRVLDLPGPSAVDVMVKEGKLPRVVTAVEAEWIADMLGYGTGLKVRG